MHEAISSPWLGLLKKRVDFFSRMLQKSSYIACMLGVSDLPDQSNWDLVRLGGVVWREGKLVPISLSFPRHPTISMCHCFQLCWKVYPMTWMTKVRSPLTWIEISSETSYPWLHLIFWLLYLFTLPVSYPFSSKPTSFYPSLSQIFLAFSLEPCFYNKKRFLYS